MYDCLCVYVHVYVCICTYIHAYIFHPEVKWSPGNISSKCPLRRVGVCAFRETTEKYQNHSV